MAKVCPITKKKVITGRKIAITRSQVSARTKRKFNINMQKTSFYSEVLDKMIKIKLTVAGIRTIENKGGIDAYLIATNDNKLDPKFKKLKKVIVKAKAKQA